MKKYSVKYFYLATGMEGKPETRDFGIIEAENEDDAINKIVLQEFPKDEFYGPGKRFSSRDFLKGCLTAVEVNNKKEKIPIVSMKMLLDNGLNGFALQLLLKSIVDKKDCKTFSPLSFIFQGIKITFEPVKE